MFLAVTGRCNLHCSHCYTGGYGHGHMRPALAQRILSEAYDLGVALVVVTGGEPLLHREFFSLPPAMPDVPFLIFTNGSFLPAFLADGAESANMLWAVSVDGPERLNDPRRGEGTFEAARQAMGALKDRGLPFAFSATLSAGNVADAMSLDFVSEMAEIGCRAGFFLEQLPGPPCDPPLGQQIDRLLAARRPESPIPLIGFPADEVRYGGCQAGGHGIVHISPDGSVEPCPAAHLAVDSLEDVSLATALASPFFAEFRRLKDDCSTGAESCAYIEHADSIQAGLSGHGARATVSGGSRPVAGARAAGGPAA